MEICFGRAANAFVSGLHTSLGSRCVLILLVVRSSVRESCALRRGAPIICHPAVTTTHRFVSSVDLCMRCTFSTGSDRERPDGRRNHVSYTTSYPESVGRN